MVRMRVSTFLFLSACAVLALSCAAKAFAASRATHYPTPESELRKLTMAQSTSDDARASNKAYSGREEWVCEPVQVSGACRRRAGSKTLPR
ncbi:exported hypothetical protein [Paraburkholderia piptadeniae]|uniref:Lipoprotein n=1 Tax=Paraburkholderia piptadeniae TaxID=1701573 RepID=A0A1N7SID3_9BURK|nr:exported hypothetical protein [Paraburkholderia piptadeniae]